MLMPHCVSVVNCEGQKDKIMTKKLDDILLLLKIGIYNVPDARNQILSLLDENKINGQDSTFMTDTPLLDSDEVRSGETQPTTTEKLDSEALDSKTDDENTILNQFPKHQICYKSDRICRYDCKGLCKDSM